MSDDILQAEPAERTRRTTTTSTAVKARPLFAVLGEFSEVSSVLQAARKVREAGYRRFDVHSPFPIHGIDKAMGIRPTLLPWIVLAGGLSGCLFGLLLAWYTNAESYPFLISGKPVFSLPANIPVIFETTVLFAAFAAVFGMLVLNRLPLLYTPLFKSATFRRSTSDRFLLVIERSDPRFDREEARNLLQSLGAARVQEVEE